MAQKSGRPVATLVFQNYLNILWVANRRKPQHTPEAYRRHPQPPNARNLFVNCKLLVGGLGYVPGVCWKFLRMNHWILMLGMNEISTIYSMLTWWLLLVAYYFEEIKPKKKIRARNMHAGKCLHDGAPPRITEQTWCLHCDSATAISPRYLRWGERDWHLFEKWLMGSSFKRMNIPQIFETTAYIWVFPKNRGKTPKWRVKIMENPMNKCMIWGYHYFWKHPYITTAVLIPPATSWWLRFSYFH